MKKRKPARITICLLSALVIVSCLFFFFALTSRKSSGKKPYQDLDAAQLSSATVRLTPPDKTVQIPDLQELTNYLKDVVIYEEDNSYQEYSGQGVTFTLMRTDGTQTSIMAYNPFLVLDGVGYRTKYEPCEALSHYANLLLEEETAVLVLETPPVLTVVCEETAVETVGGTYSWEKRNADGMSTHTEADSAHPLDCKDLLLPVAFETEERTAVLRFAEEPDTIVSIRCWSDAFWGDTSAKAEEVTWDGMEIELKPGGYIYEVAAKWNAENGYGGVAYYSFYLKGSSSSN